MLFLILVRPKLEYTSTETKKLARIQRKFVVLYQNRSFTYDHVTCEDFLKCLKLHNPHERRLHLMHYFLILFAQFQDVAPLFRILLVFKFFSSFQEPLPL
jgi:hypothetical protein